LTRIDTRIVNFCITSRYLYLIFGGRYERPVGELVGALDTNVSRICDSQGVNKGYSIKLSSVVVSGDQTHAAIHIDVANVRREIPKRFKIRSKHVFDVGGKSPQIYTIPCQMTFDAISNILHPSLGVTFRNGASNGASGGASPTIQKKSVVEMIEAGATDSTILEMCPGISIAKIRIARADVTSKLVIEQAKAKIAQHHATPWQVFLETLIRIECSKVSYWLADSVDSEKGSDLAMYLNATGKALVLYSSNIVSIRQEALLWEQRHGKIKVVIFDAVRLGIAMGKPMTLELCRLVECIRDGKITLGTSAPPATFVFAQRGPMMSMLDSIDVDRWMIALPKAGHAVGHLICGSYVPREVVNSILAQDPDDVPVIHYRSLLAALGHYEPTIMEMADGEYAIDVALRILWNRFGFNILESSWHRGLETRIRFAESGDRPNIGHIGLDLIEMSPLQKHVYEQWQICKKDAMMAKLSPYVNILNEVRLQYGMPVVAGEIKDRKILTYVHHE
jgi:hypothetical protein